MYAIRSYYACKGYFVVQPAQLELLPSAHVTGCIPNVLLAGVHPGAGGHQSPETGPVLAAGSVVQIRQAQIMAILVGKDTHTAIFRLNGVLPDP